MTYEQLMQAYEKAAMAFHKTKPMTQAANKAAKRMEKAIEALEQYRATKGE
jgi:quinol monooxygenase YgiN